MGNFSLDPTREKGAKDYGKISDRRKVPIRKILEILEEGGRGRKKRYEEGASGYFQYRIVLGAAWGLYGHLILHFLSN